MARKTGGSPKEAAAQAAQQDLPSETDGPAPYGADDELITLPEAARLFGVHPSTFRRYVSSGDAPEPVVLGSRGAEARAQAFRFWKSELLAFRRNQLPRASETDSSWRKRPRKEGGQ